MALCEDIFAARFLQLFAIEVRLAHPFLAVCR